MENIIDELLEAREVAARCLVLIAQLALRLGESPEKVRKACVEEFEDHPWLREGCRTALQVNRYLPEDYRRRLLEGGPEAGVLEVMVEGWDVARTA